MENSLTQTLIRKPSWVVEHFSLPTEEQKTVLAEALETGNLLAVTVQETVMGRFLVDLQVAVPEVPVSENEEEPMECMACFEPATRVDLKHIHVCELHYGVSKGVFFKAMKAKMFLNQNNPYERKS